MRVLRLTPSRLPLSSPGNPIPQEGAPGPLSVKWAEPDPKAKHSSKGGDEGQKDADDRTVFFARVLRSATEESVRALFSKFGNVVDVNLFRAFQVGNCAWDLGLALPTLLPSKVMQVI